MIRSVDEHEQRQIIRAAFEIVIDGVTANCHSPEQEQTAIAGAYIAGLLLANTCGMYSAETYKLATSIMQMAAEVTS